MYEMLQVNVTKREDFSILYILCIFILILILQYHRTNDCEPCEVDEILNSAKYYCMNCEEHLCLSCKKSHSSMKYFKSHNFVDEMEIPKQYNALSFCSRHKDMRYEFYCTDHEIPCCGLCINIEHCRCKTEYLGTLARGIRQMDLCQEYEKQLSLLRDILKQNRLDNPTEDKKRDMFLNITEDEKVLFDFILRNGSEIQLFLFLTSSRTTLHDIKTFYSIPMSEQKAAQAPILERAPSRTRLAKCYKDLKYIPCLKQLHQFRITDIAITNNDELLLCDKDNLKIAVCNLDKDCKYINLEHFPHNIATIPGTNTAVLTCKKAQYIQRVDLLELKFHSKQKAHGTSGCGISVSDTNVIVGGKEHVYFFNHKLEKIGQLAIKGVEGKIRSLSYYKAKLFLIESGSNRIQCIGEKGNKLSSFDSKDLVVPTKIISDKQGNVYVLESALNAIIQLTNGLDTVNTLLTAFDGLTSPTTFCFNNTCTAMYVPNQSGTSILIFELLYDK